MKDYASGSNHITNLQRLILVLTKGNPKDTNERIILIWSANLRFVKPPREGGNSFSLPIKIPEYHKLPKPPISRKI